MKNQKEMTARFNRTIVLAVLVFLVAAATASALGTEVRVSYPTENFSRLIKTANTYSSWSLVTKPEWVRMPNRTSGGPADIATFAIVWDMIPYGSLNGTIELVIDGLSSGTAQYSIRLSAVRRDPAATPTPEVLGTPMPTLPAMVTFEGYVYTADSFAPISGAMVTLAGSSMTASATSAPDGSYTVGVPVGNAIDVSLSVSAFEYIPQSYDFTGMLSQYNHDFPMSDIMSGTPEPTVAPRKRGDINGDGQITIVDALMAAQCYIGLRPQVIGIPDPCEAVYADFDCNGIVNIIDALKIAQYYVGIIVSPC